MPWVQVVGYSLIDEAVNSVIGKIVAVDGTTVNTPFGVSTSEGGEISIPANDEPIVTTDTAPKATTMQIPSGLLDL